MLATSPDYVPARRHLARALARLGSRDLEEGRRQQALRRAEVAIRWAPDEPSAHLLRGSVLAQQGRNEEALDAIGRALELRPDRWMSHFQRSQVLRAAGRDDDAMAALREAIALNPEHEDLAGALVVWEGAGPAGS